MGRPKNTLNYLEKQKDEVHGNYIPSKSIVISSLALEYVYVSLYFFVTT